MRPIIHNEISGYLITEGLVNRCEEQVPEPGPQPDETGPSSFENQLARQTFGQRVKNFFGFKATPRPVRVRNCYQRDY